MVAYGSENPAADQDRLVEAGAVVADELMTTPSGDTIVMLRDPWGVPIQLVKRARPDAVNLVRSRLLTSAATEFFI